MKRRVRALLMAMVMVFTMLASTLGGAIATSADDELVVKLHYNRPDGQYDTWDVWFWPKGGEGAGYAFAKEGDDMVATFTVPEGTSELGYIVRKGNWESKDVGEDQFIDIAEYISGTVHVYVESGVKGQTVVDTDAKKGSKLTSAKYDGENIKVTIAGKHGAVTKAFVIEGAEGQIEITTVTGSNGSYTVKIGQKLNLAKNYSITYEGIKYPISMPDFYSSKEFEDQFTYTGDDLGANWTQDATNFRLWAPTADSVKINLYQSGTKGTDDLIKTVDMKADVNGTWVATVEGDLHKTYYTYVVTIGGKQIESVDPYAKATGVNGDRSMVINMASTNPEGWENDKNPNAHLSFNDAIIYELHVRDLSSDSSAGISNIGKYLGLTEHGTKTPGGMATGIDHIKELGITHLHLLPVYDYGSVDETKLNTNQFNWGYDPENFNVPEGSYSTDPYNGEVRVAEFKQMVQSLHNDGISVIMDVVYNHVYNAGEFCVNKIVPQYFSRVTNGVYSNGSGCGNDTASERKMVSKYIVDSILYWVEEYHIDGFRFDLVGLIDTDTINTIMEEVHKVRPDVVFYGEGWTMSTSVTKDNVSMTTQGNSSKVPGFAFFSDNMRDALKGGVFNNTEKGFVSGASGKESIIRECFLGLAGTWCTTPNQAINYASCHDNNTLYDRIILSRPDASQADIIKMNNLSAAIYMTSQGIPFIHAGEEMLRSKPLAEGGFSHNSYNLPDSVNSIKWGELDNSDYQAVFEYYKGLIAFRKAHPVLRLSTSAEVTSHMTALTDLPKNAVGFKVEGNGMEGESAKTMYIFFNANTESITYNLPEGNWNVYVQGNKAGTEVLTSVNGTATIDAISTLILVEEAPVASAAGVDPVTLAIVIGVGVGVLAAAGVIGVAAVNLKKKN